MSARALTLTNLTAALLADVTANGAAKGVFDTLFFGATTTTPGTGAFTLGAFTMGATATEQRASAAFAPAAFTMGAVAVERFTASAALAPAAFTMSAAAAEGVVASATFAPGSFTMSATAVERFVASAALAPAAFTLSAAATHTHPIIVSAAFAPAAFTLSAAAREQTAAAALHPASFIMSGVVRFPVRAAGAFAPAAFTLSAAAQLITHASAALKPAPFTLSAVVEQSIATAAPFQLGAFIMDAAATVSPAGAGSFVLGLFTMGAAASEQAAAAPFHPGRFLMAGGIIIHFPHTGPLEVTGVSPDFGATLTSVTITGHGFNGATRVAFGSVSDARVIVSVTDTEIVCISDFSPYYLAGGNHDDLTVDVQVFTIDEPAGSPITPADEFTFLAPPVIYSITPNAGSTTAATHVIITGKNFRHTFGSFLGPYGVGAVVDGDISFDGTVIEMDLGTESFVSGSGTYEFRLFNLAGFSTFFNPLFTVFNALVPDTTPQLVQDTIAGRYGPVAFKWRFEVRDRANNFLQDITAAVREDTGCSLHLNNFQPVARTADFIFDAAGLPAGFDCGESTPRAVAVFEDLNVQGTVYSWQRGLFHLDAPDIDQYALGSEEWTAKGSDMVIVLAVQTTRSTYTLPIGSDYIGTITSICRGFGLTTNLPTISSAVAPTDITWPAGTTWLQIVNDMLFGLNFYPAFADETGRISSRVRVDPALESATVLYDTTAEPRMVVASPSRRSFNVAQLWNWVNVAIDDPSRSSYVASQSNNDPVSPASIAATGGKQVFQAFSGSSTPSTKAIPSPQVADAIAAFEVRDQASRAITRTLETQPDPRRTNREWYRLKLEGYEDFTLWRVVGWEESSAPGGPMTHTLELCSEFEMSGVLPTATVVQTLGTLGEGTIDGIVPGQGNILEAQLPVAGPTTPGNTIAVVVLTDQVFLPYWTMEDSAGNKYAIQPLGTGNFGDAQPDGQFGVFLAYVTNAQPLRAGDTLNLSFGVGPHQLAMVAYELSGLQAEFWAQKPVTWAQAQASDPSGHSVLSTADSGTGPAVTTPYDLIFGIAAGMWNAASFDGEPDPGYSFAPDAGEGWPSSGVIVTTQPRAGLYSMLAVFLQIGLAEGATYRMSGTFSNPATGVGAYAVPLQGQQA